MLLVLILSTLSFSLTGSWKVESINGTNVTTLNILLLQGMREIKTESLTLAKMAETSLRKEGKLPDQFIFNIIHRRACQRSIEKYQFEPVKEAAEVYHENGIDAIIGPYCSGGMKQISQLAVQWNIPVIGYLSVDSFLTDRKLYRTLARVSITLSSLGQAVATLVEHFKWKKVGILKDETDIWGMSIYHGVTKALIERNITINVNVSVAEKKIDKELPDAWEKLIARARSLIIIIICAGYYSPDRFLAKIAEYNMTQPGFLFIVPFASEGLYKAHLKPKMVKKGYSQSLMVSGQGLDKDRVETVTDRLVDEYGVSLEGNTYRNYSGWEKYFRIWYPLVHDAFYLYYSVVGELILRNESDIIFDGKRFWTRETHRTFVGASGHVWLDHIAERMPSYLVRTMHKGFEKKVMTLDIQSKCVGNCIKRGGQTLGKLEFEWLPRLVWKELEDNMEIPIDEPPCGFTGAKCDMTNVYLTIGGTIMAVIICAFAYWRYKKMKEAALFKMPWRISADSVVKVRKANSMVGSMASLGTHFSAGTNLSAANVHDAVMIGLHMSHPTRHKQLQNIDFKRSVLAKLNELKGIHHENLSLFIGLCFNDVKMGEVVIFWELTTRGTLEDILLNMDLHLEPVFQASFTKDVIKGLEYIHRSPVAVHGNLNAYTCLVTSHWILKLSSFGIHGILYELVDNKEISYNQESSNRLLFVAPELLKERVSLDEPMPGSQHGDIYSLGLIIYEVLYREEPFDEHLGAVSAEAMLKAIVEKPNEQVPKPQIPVDDQIDKRIIDFMKDCWNDDPEQRPTLAQAKVVGTILSPVKGSLVDNMMTMMEKYAGNLEKLVKDRTVMLEDAQTRADNLLFRMLPMSVALDLKAGKPIEPKTFVSATVLFSDIVGFTNFCSESSPLEIVNFLNSLFSEFDKIIDSHQAYKVETIGDAYMVVSGVPIPNGTHHCHEIGGIALRFRWAAQNFLLENNKTVEVRIGVASGPVAAGVVGLTTPRYCLFGDTVNTASRMESTGVPMKIQITEITKLLLDEYEGLFEFEERGQISVKGKGQMTTFWLEKGLEFSPNTCETSAKL